jgi:hypothetical protein
MNGVHISLDIETLSTNKNAVVASIGACRVTKDGLVEHTESDFYCRVQMQEQIDFGRHVSEDTLRFWMAQEATTRGDTFNGVSLTPIEALDELRKWVDKGEHEGVWTKGPAFDGAILESLAESYGEKPAWHFRDHRDIRTLDAVIEMSSNDDLKLAWFEAREEFSASNRAAHNALEDAKAQGRLLSWFMKGASE